MFKTRAVGDEKEEIVPDTTLRSSGNSGKWDFWIDRGGTFTDIVARSPDGELKPHKLLSENPELYADAAIQGIRDILGISQGTRIPAERMKMRQPHDVPLSRQALSVIKDIWPLSDGCELVFASVRSQDRPLSNNAFNAALRRMGYSKDEVTAHGFRVTASSILNSRGYDPDVIEAVLAHQDRNSTRRAYNRASYLDQRVVLMQEWGELLDQLRDNNGSFDGRSNR